MTVEMVDARKDCVITLVFAQKEVECPQTSRRCVEMYVGLEAKATTECGGRSEESKGARGMPTFFVHGTGKMIQTSFSGVTSPELGVHYYILRYVGVVLVLVDGVCTYYGWPFPDPPNDERLTT